MASDTKTEKCLAFAGVEDLSLAFEQLVQLEHEEEIKQAKDVLDCRSLRELVARGFCVPNLILENHNTGIHGRHMLHFAPGGGKGKGEVFRTSTLKQGDIVGVRWSNDPIQTGGEKDDDADVTGVVWKMVGNSITIALDEKSAHGAAFVGDGHCKGKFNLVKLANDVTYRRYKRCLEQLRCLESPLVSSLVQNVSYGTHAQDSSEVEDMHWFNPALDESQRSAVRFCLPYVRPDDRGTSGNIGRNYAPPRPVSVVHGPPGTGKTTTVAEIICQYVKLKVKVLLCAPSNVAVDNVLEKLLPYKKDIKMIRLGHPARVASDLHRHTLEHLLHSGDESEVMADIRREIDSSVAAANRTRDGGARRKIWADLKQLRKDLALREKRLMRDSFKRCDVVLSTLTTATDIGPLKHVQEDHFGLVIIDEAAQAIEPACWIPLLKAPACILAGDHHQLPPTIVSEQAAKNGLDVTMMERIVAKQADDVVRMLTTQYRMHEHIMHWSSSYLYDSRLVAHEAVAQHRLCDLPGVESDPDSTDLPLLLIDTAGCNLEELSTDSDMSKGNEGEADLVAIHVRKLIQLGIQPSDIAVISPYNLQVEMMRRRLNPEFENLGVHSVDGYQGREKEAVVISLVRSNPARKVGFLSEDRRLNVAVTRARRHLCVVCDSDTVRQNRAIDSLLDYMEEAGEVHSAASYQEDPLFGSFVDRRVSYADTSMKKMLDKPKAKSAVGHGKTSKHVQSHTSVPHVSGQPSSDAADSLSTRKREADVLLEYAQRLDDFIASENMCLVFPASLSSYERRVVHQVCTDKHLNHESRGEGANRHIVVQKLEGAEQSSSPGICKTSNSSSADTAVEVSAGSSEVADAVVSMVTDSGPRVPDLPSFSEDICQLDHKSGIGPSAAEPSGKSPTLSASPVASAASPVTSPVVSTASASASASAATSEALAAATARSKIEVPGCTDSFATSAPAPACQKGSGIKTSSTMSTCTRCQRSVPTANLDLHRFRCVLPVPTSTKAPDTASSAATATSRKKDKKPKAKASSATAVASFSVESDDFDSMLDEVRKQDSVCALHGCKKPVGLVGRACDFCRRRFCLTHLQAEVHGCGDAVRHAARQQFAARSTSTSSRDAKALQKKLQKQIDSKQEQRSAKRKK